MSKFTWIQKIFSWFSTLCLYLARTQNFRMNTFFILKWIHKIQIRTVFHRHDVFEVEFSWIHSLKFFILSFPLPLKQYKSLLLEAVWKVHMQINKLLFLSSHVRNIIQCALFVSLYCILARKTDLIDDL